MEGGTGAAGPEVPNPEGLEAFSGRAAEEAPVAMLNLLAFRPDGGRERYAEYGAAVAPLLEKVGGRIVFGGEASPAVIGARSWDMVAVVEYPTRAAFLELVASPEYAEIADLRTEALERGELHPIDPSGEIDLGSLR
jgi:uncharacterized protein (DUF1330 family)